MLRINLYCPVVFPGLCGCLVGSAILAHFHSVSISIVSYALTSYKYSCEIFLLRPRGSWICALYVMRRPCTTSPLHDSFMSLCSFTFRSLTFSLSETLLSDYVILHSLLGRLTPFTVMLQQLHRSNLFIDVWKGKEKAAQRQQGHARLMESNMYC